MSYVDIHSHILPNMDDGAKDMGETLKMLQIAWQEGIAHIIATPHYKAGRFQADAQRLERTLDKVRQEIKKRNIPVTLYAGNEIYYHSELEEKFQTGAISTLNGTGYVRFLCCIAFFCNGFRTGGNIARVYNSFFR